MPTLIYADEPPRTFKEVANYLKNAAARLEAFGETLKQEEIEFVSVPMKTMVFDALGAIEKWTCAAQGAYLEYKKTSGALGPSTAGKGPKAGKPSPGSGNFRKASKKRSRSKGKE